MRIAYLVTSLGMGGAERQALMLARRMAQRGHAVALLALLPPVAEEWPTTIDVAHLNMGKTPWSIAAALARGRRVLRKFRPDILHSHCFHSNMTARAMKLLLPGVEVISTVHNVYEGGWARMQAYRLSNGLSRRTAFVCEAGARRYVGLGAVSMRRCAVIPNGTDTAEFAPDPRRRDEMRAAMSAEGKFIWLAAGRVAKAKDYPNLIEAFASAHAQRPESELWIAGEATEAAAQELLRLTVQLGVAGSLRWLGLRRDMPALLDAADGFVLASAWEGMPLALAEAMAMGKPIVATDAGGVRELAGDAGAIVPVKEPDLLARAMLGLMDRGPEECAAIGRAARTRIEARFTIEAGVKAWERLYECVLERDSG
jgi:glycosyltransferase involved in cell wall biosynthesis